MSKKNGITGTLLSVGGIVILAKIFGFIKQTVTANTFGATIQTDIISLSEGLVGNLDYLLVQTLATAFIPTYIYAKSEDKEKGDLFISNAIKVFLIISLAISAAVFAGAPLVSRVLAPSYPAAQSAWLAKYIRIFAPVLVVIVELAIFNAVLKANEIFLPGEMIGLNQSLILIALVLLFGNRWGPDTLAVGFYAYALFNLTFLIFMSRNLWHFRRGNMFADPNIRKLLLMMGPLLLGYAMVFINQHVDMIIVSGLGDGTVTAMGYAAVLSNFVGTFVGSLCGVLFTYVTQGIAEKRDRDAAELTMKSACQIGTLLLPISILIVICSKDIVTIVFGRGKFDATAVQSCSMALIGYGSMFVPLVARELFSRFQYAYGDSKRPMINSTIAIVFNIVFSILLSRFMGVLGVTLATSISVLISAVLNVFSSRKKNRHINLHGIARYIPIWLVGALACAGIALGGMRLLAGAGSLLRFVCITAAALAVYGVIALPIIKPLIGGLMKGRR